MAQIGQLFIEAGLISPSQLEEALRAKAVYGGRLGTNLVELGYIDDATLHNFLAHQLGVPAMGALDSPTPEALARLPALHCDRLNVLPLRFENRKLMVASIDPTNEELRVQVEAASGCKVQLVVASEGRLYALMRAVLGIERTLRYAVIEAEAQRAGRAQLHDSALHSILRDQAFISPATGEADDEVLLLDTVVEEAPLIGELIEDAPAPAPAPVPASPAPVVAAPPAIPLAVAPAAVEPPAPVDTPPAAATSADFESRPTAEVRVELVRSFDLDVHTAEIQIQPAAAPTAQRGVAEVHAGLGDDLRPLSFIEALEGVARCDDRDALAKVVLRFMLSHYRRALIFTVQRGLVLGWDGLGNRVDGDLAQKLMIPVNAPSVFGQVCSSRQPYVGPLDDSPLTGLFVKILGGERPQTCHLIPFVVGQRLVAILYGDGPIGSLNVAQSSEVTMLMAQVRATFERFMARVGGPAT